MERIVRAAIEAPPAECLTPPRRFTPMVPGEDWRIRAVTATEGMEVNAAIADACQRWAARLREAGDGTE